MEAKPVILDVDPGIDDALAILFAAKHPQIDLKGITVVCGNQTLDKTVCNTLNILSFANMSHIPVYAGMEAPIMRSLVTAGHIHGESGLEGWDFPPLHLQAQREHAVDFIIRQALQEPAGLTLVAVGPLTNVAMALRREPRIKSKIKHICFMGGCLGEGNVTSSAEFNMYVDPEAASIVLNSGVPLTMVGLELTDQARIQHHTVAQLRTRNSAAVKMAVGLILAYQKRCQHHSKIETPPLHDVCAVAYVADPSLMKTTAMQIDVETKSDLTLGRTVFDRQGKPANVHVALQLDQNRFWQVFLDTLGRYESP